MAADFGEFYFGSYKRLFRVVVLLCASPADAEDVLHEAYSRALGRWSRVGRLDQPEAWVRRVAINLSTDTHRSRQRARLAWPRLVQPDVPGPETSSTHDVVAALRVLSDVQRRVVVLHHLADQSVETVAHELNLPVNTVKSHLARGRARLAELLRGHAEVVPDGG